MSEYISFKVGKSELDIQNFECLREYWMNRVNAARENKSFKVSLIGRGIEDLKEPAEIVLEYIRHLTNRQKAIINENGAFSFSDVGGKDNDLANALYEIGCDSIFNISATVDICRKTEAYCLFLQYVCGLYCQSDTFEIIF